MCNSLREKDTESLEDWFWNFVPAAETVPFDGKAGLAQCVAKSLRSDIRQELILRSMALKDRQPFSFLEQRNPFLCGEERSGQLDQPGIGLRLF